MIRFRFNPGRVFSICSAIFLFVAFITSLHLKLQIGTFIPSQKVVIVTHGLSFLLSVIVIFKPVLCIQVFVLMCESILTIMTGYQTLGVFLFYAIVILMFVNGKFRIRPVLELLPFVILHILSLLLTYKQGIFFVFMGLANSFFYAAFFYWIYDILRAKLSCFLPAETKNNSIIKEKPGEQLHLSDYNLSERQVNFILDNLHKNSSYKELSETYFVSLSTVKKEFSELYRIFNVTKLEELRHLLLQFQVSR